MDNLIGNLIDVDEGVSAETGTGGDLLLLGVEPLVPGPTKSAITSGTGRPKPGSGGAVLVDLLVTTAGNATGGGEIPSPFTRSSKTPRTPPRADAVSASGGGPTNPGKPRREGTNQTPGGRSAASVRPRGGDTAPVSGGGPATPAGPEGESATNVSGGGQTTTVKPRSEEEMLARCRAVVRSMKAVTTRQRNISTDIKNGIAELEDLLDAITFSRAEKEKSEKTKEERERSRVARKELIGPTAGTPTIVAAPTQKRTASSPLQRDEEKKRKEQEASNLREEVRQKEETRAEWTVAGKKKKKKREKAKADGPAKAPGKEETASNQGKGKKKKTPKPRRDALLIKPAQGKSYAEVLGEIRRKVNPADTGTEVRSIRQTRAGGVLVEFGAKAGDKAAFGAALRNTLGSAATIRSLEPKESVEIRDLDDLTTKEEVIAAIRGAIGELAENINVSITGANSRAQRAALVTLGAKGASQLLKAQRIKIGWVNCRVRQRVTVPRCFRCLGYGHFAGECRGPDRSRLCYKCGKGGHNAKQCSAPEYCVLCAESGVGPEGLKHAAGSGKCAVFKGALERCKSLAR